MSSRAREGRSWSTMLPGLQRAEIIREKGTNRSQFFRGQVDKYTWVDIGSSFLPGEIVAAFLLAQLEKAELITARRLALWERYHSAFASLERDGRFRRPDRRGWLWAERAHVLPPAARSCRAACVHRPHETAGHTLRISLCAAALARPWARTSGA